MEELVNEAKAAVAAVAQLHAEATDVREELAALKASSTEETARMTLVAYFVLAVDHGYAPFIQDT